MSDAPDSPPFVSRAGGKLDAAVVAFGVEVAGRTCADLGSHTGGFVDCLLRRGAERVYAVEAGKGVLHWRLRNDPRVVVCEGCNALHWRPPAPVDLVSVDLGWTPQRLAIPAALGMIRPGGLVITLVKPQYEAEAAQRRGGLVRPEAIAAVLDAVRGQLARLHVTIEGWMESPIRGTKGNVEYLAQLRLTGSV